MTNADKLVHTIKNCSESGVGISEKVLVQASHSRFIVNIFDKYVLAKDVDEDNPELRATKGSFFIKYEPEGSPFRKEGSPFVFGNDLFGFKFKISGSTDFRKLAGTFPEIAWVLRNTNYKDSIFQCAKMHPGIMVFFSVNWCDYCDMIIDKLWADGLDPLKNKPLVTFKFACNEKNAKIKNMDDIAFCINKEQFNQILAENNLNI